jgi:hypothetical protein
MPLASVATLARTVRGMPRQARLSSLTLSYRHARRSFFDLPIVAGPGSVIGRPAGARLDLGGQFFLGYSLTAWKRR